LGLEGDLGVALRVQLGALHAVITGVISALAGSRSHRDDSGHLIGLALQLKLALAHLEGAFNRMQYVGEGEVDFTLRGLNLQDLLRESGSAEDEQQTYEGHGTNGFFRSHGISFVSGKEH
jgi:hypothetical protein